MLAYEEVQKHSTAKDLWVIVKGQAYDLSDVSLLPSTLSTRSPPLFSATPLPHTNQHEQRGNGSRRL